MALCDPFDFDDPGSVPRSEYGFGRTGSEKSLGRLSHYLKGDEMATKTLDAGAMKLSNTERPRLSQYATGGEFTPMEKVEGRELLIQSIDPIETKFGGAFKLGCIDEISGEVHVLCAGQMVIKGAIEALLAEANAEGREVQYPIPVRFIKPGKAWLVE